LTARGILPRFSARMPCLAFLSRALVFSCVCPASSAFDALLARSLRSGAISIHALGCPANRLELRPFGPFLGCSCITAVESVRIAGTSEQNLPQYFVAPVGRHVVRTHKYHGGCAQSTVIPRRVPLIVRPTEMGTGPNNGEGSKEQLGTSLAFWGNGESASRVGVTREAGAIQPDEARERIGKASRQSEQKNAVRCCTFFFDRPISRGTKRLRPSSPGRHSSHAGSFLADFRLP